MNTSQAFQGTVAFNETSEEQVYITWTKDSEFAELKANLRTHEFSVRYSEGGEEQFWNMYGKVSSLNIK